ncbi:MULTISPECIES: GNAT family N-acetyltransferase [Actinomycetes]|jgi:predicted GNAT family acetyltransferase|uniref:GNAT family N-acetyltransferase n=1 Tax=Actinomycetes TaxID=1760 RepID=UPI000837B0AC|nr:MULTISPECIES: GNAT family N-acetyltransferase [Actinomycetes]
MESNQESMVTLTGSDQVVRELAHPATGAIEAEKVTITDNKEAGVYELWVDGQTAAGLLYNEAGTRVTILATAVFPKFRGKGIAGNLLGGVLDLLRAEGRTATLTCPFATAFVHSHPQYADVVDPTFPGNARSGHGRIH